MTSTTSPRAIKPTKLKETGQLVLDDPLSLVSIFTFLNSNDLDALGEAVGHIFLVNSRSGDLLTLCATEEIYGTARAEQLLRQDSIYIVILQHFVKRRGRRWLYNTLRKPLRKIIQSDFSIEIDKMRLSANEDLTINRENLEQTIRSVLDPIFEKPEIIPSEIGAMIKLLFQITNEKFPGEGYKVLSGSLFLRFICPFIGSPKSWHLLTRAEILPETRRKLILVAKVVQGIANELEEFNEVYMNQIHHLLVEYTEKLHKFYDKLMHISPSIQNTSWSNAKERKNQLSLAQQTIAEFFIDNFSNIEREIIQPLSSIFVGADVFGKRLELLFFEELYEEQSFLFVDNRNRSIINQEIQDELKELRKEQGNHLWSFLFELLRNCVNKHGHVAFSGCNFFHLQFIFLPRNIYNIDNNQKSPRSRRKRMALPIRSRGGTRRKSSILQEVNDNPLSLSPKSNTRATGSHSNSILVASNNNDEATYSDVFTEMGSEEDEIIDSDSPIYCWLQTIGCEEYYQVFADSKVTPEQLARFSTQDLMKIGIHQENVRIGMVESLKDGSFFPGPGGHNNSSNPVVNANGVGTGRRKKRGNTRRALAPTSNPNLRQNSSNAMNRQPASPSQTHKKTERSKMGRGDSVFARISESQPIVM